MAIINHTWKFIFVHIPKCGGTSVAHALEPLCSYRDLQLGGTPFGEQVHRAYGPKYGMAKHSLGVELRRAVGQDVWNSYTTFATVRDPVERTVSTYRYLKHHEEHYRFMERIESLEEFLDSPEWATSGPDRMFEPQALWVYEDLGFRDQIVDRLIPLRDAADELPDLLAGLGVPRAELDGVTMPHINVSPGEKHADVSQLSRARIHERYEYDVKKI